MRMISLELGKNVNYYSQQWVKNDHHKRHYNRLKDYKSFAWLFALCAEFISIGWKFKLVFKAPVYEKAHWCDKEGLKGYRFKVGVWKVLPNYLPRSWCPAHFYYSILSGYLTFPWTIRSDSSTWRIWRYQKCLPRRFSRISVQYSQQFRQFKKLQKRFHFCRTIWYYFCSRR